MIVAAASVLVLLTLAACRTPAASPAPSQAQSATPDPSSSPTSSASPEPSETVESEFDFAGTAWRATSLAGRSPPPGEVPMLEFDFAGRPSGYGFTGCEDFGFAITLDGGRFDVGDLVLSPSACTGPAADTEAAFLTAFRAAETWSVAGDHLALTGPGGRIDLARRLPPAGTPGRVLADTLREGAWRILSISGVADVGWAPRLVFFDSILTTEGDCGFVAQDVRFMPSGDIDLIDVGSDAMGTGEHCPGDVELKRILEAVTRGQIAVNGTVGLTGPEGTVVLGR